jgi:hypothetical protein
MTDPIKPELLNIRDTRVYAEKKFKYTNNSLFTQLKVKRPNLSNKKNKISNIKLVINDVEIKPTTTTDNFWIWDVYTIRNDIRDLFPETDEEVLLKRLETTLVYNGLRAIQFYNGLTHDELSNSIFSLELDIYFNFTAINSPKYLDIIETYLQSDIRKECDN